MKILYYNVIQANAKWGAETFINDAFHKLGHETYCIDYRHNRNNLDSIALPLHDIVFLQRGDYFPLKQLEKSNKPKFFWNSELVVRCKDNHHLFIPNLFDHIFARTEQCRKILNDDYHIPYEKTSMILGAFDSYKWKPILDPFKEHDILFFGNITDRRKAILQELSNYVKIVHIKAYGDELIEHIRRSKIVLNIHAENALDTETRVYEVLGCGALLISEMLSPENPFINGKHLVEFNSILGCVDALHNYLIKPVDGQLIAFNGLAEAHREHSYIKRTKELISKFEEFV